jgi:7-carboxy-7-deazaguanine synthase
MSSPQTRRQSQKTASKTLRINEIFYSLQGEARYTGLPTVFIRLAGCPYRCVYCDTAYAFHDGNTLSINNIIQTISCYRTRHVTVTGGEPLAQKTCLDFLVRLCDEGFQVSLETSGAMDLSRVDERVVKIVDIKTPGSGEADKNRFDNLEHISNSDQIKFVICDRDDYVWAKQKLYDFIQTCRNNIG